VSVQYDLDLNYWANMLVLLIMLWLIVNLGESIALVLEVKGSAAHNHNTVVLCLVLVAILVQDTPDGFWATYNDIVIYWFAVAYVVAYALYHMQNRNTINVIIGCMILVAGRYYQTNETPYVATFLFLIAARVIQKLYYTLWGKSDVPRPGLAVRAAGVHRRRHRPVLAHVRLLLHPLLPTPIQAHLYLLGILFAAHCLGSFIAHYVKTKHALAEANPKLTST
jgi:hypothetical protein